MQVLLAVVTNDSCSLGFAVSMLRLQVALATAPDVQVTIELVSSLAEAVELANTHTKFDALVAIRSTIGFPAAFVMRGLVTGPFVAGVYPLPRLDWDRVVAKKDDASEDMRFKGNVYNIDPAAAKRVAAQLAGYMSAPSAELGAVVLHREALRALADKPLGTDDDVCRAWGKDVLVDLDAQCSNFGPVEFTGCVGLRTVLR